MVNIAHLQVENVLAVRRKDVDVQEILDMSPVIARYHSRLNMVIQSNAIMQF